MTVNSSANSVIFLRKIQIVCGVLQPRKPPFWMYGHAVFNIPSSGARFSERGVNISQIPQHMWPREGVLGKALKIIGGRGLVPPSYL